MNASDRNPWSPLQKGVVLSGVAILFVFVAIPLLRQQRIGDPPASCRNKLKQLALSLHNYHDTYSTLPPAYIADENGRPMHSWRVLLLPFFDRKDLYERYRFDEPWDGPHNRLLHKAICSYFVCPDFDSSEPGGTSYLAVVGRNTMWPGAESTKMQDATSGDGTVNTIFLVEVRNSGIHWMEPRDLSFDSMEFRINGTDGNSLAGDHQHRERTFLREFSGRFAHVALVDGSVPKLPLDADAATLRALFTRNGGEPVEVPAFQPDGRYRPQAMWTVAGIASGIVCLVCVIWHRRRVLKRAKPASGEANPA